MAFFINFTACQSLPLLGEVASRGDDGEVVQSSCYSFSAIAFRARKPMSVRLCSFSNEIFSAAA